MSEKIQTPFLHIKKSHMRLKNVLIYGNINKEQLGEKSKNFHE